MQDLQDLEKIFAATKQYQLCVGTRLFLESVDLECPSPPRKGISPLKLSTPPPSSDKEDKDISFLKSVDLECPTPPRKGISPLKLSTPPPSFDKEDKNDKEKVTESGKRYPCDGVNEGEFLFYHDLTC